MSSLSHHSPRELKRLQRNLDEALATLTQRQRAFERYGDDPVSAATVQRQLDTAKRQVAVARYQLERKPVDVDAFLRTQILRWEERTDQLIAEGRRHAGE
jgi:hypothetical protein